MTKKTVGELTQALEAVIEKMQKIQRKIAADEQPTSMSELDSLTKHRKEVRQNS
ncbi:MAG: hypothetical protein ACI9J2_002331 [Saprospiraceae bacterium]|jgi:hypothetical protein